MNTVGTERYTLEETPWTEEPAKECEVTRTRGPRKGRGQAAQRGGPLGVMATNRVTQPGSARRLPEP